MSYLHLTQTLAESFNALADEVQSLADRKTILEHKLRYAHEQYQYLADKYAPSVPEIAETLAKLQLPPDLQSPFATATSCVVPLPRRCQPGSAQHHIALCIREGRRAAQQLVSSMGDLGKDCGSSKGTSFSPESAVTMTSTVLEQDFTVPGRQGPLACPFSAKARPVVEPRTDGDPAGDLQSPNRPGATASLDPTPHQPSDPICVAMLDDHSPAPGAAAAAAAAASKCPIRFLDKHSPEEIARYVETHKHEIPRSHEVCVRRYQRNEEQIRKLDAKYGNLVSMISDLSHLHRPMLPSPADQQPHGGSAQLDRASSQRVEDWAQAVTPSDPDQADDVSVDDGERENNFDRPLRDVRLGESPSRPWGIPVPLEATHPEAPRELASPEPAPIQQEPSQTPGETATSVPARKCPFGNQPPKEVAVTAPAGKCPFGSQPPKEVAAPAPARKCPFDHTKMGAGMVAMPKHDAPPTSNHFLTAAEPRPEPATQQPSASVETQAPPAAPLPGPTFVNLGEMPMPKAGSSSVQPQVVFNISGPVFIGYPMEQAIQFLQQLQGQGQGRGQGEDHGRD